MILRTRIAAALVGTAALFLVALPAGAQETPPATVPPGTVVAVIDGVEVTEAELTMVLNELGEQFAQLPEDKKRAAALAALIEIRVTSNEAVKRGMDQNEEFKRRLALLRERALHAALLQEAVLTAITDADVQARYEKYVAETPPTPEVQARHILVETEEEAKAIIARLDAGEDFATIAKEVSKDPGSGANGGELGWFGQGRMVPEFEKAAFELEAGAYTKQPVKSDFGWHVIKVDAKRGHKPLEELVQQIRSLVFREKYTELVNGLRGAAKIEFKDPALEAAVGEFTR